MAGSKMVWNIDLTPLLGKKVAVETREGHIRKATLTRVDFLDCQVIGITVGIPDRLVLDGDDYIPWTAVKTMDLA